MKTTTAVALTLWTLGNLAPGTTLQADETRRVIVQRLENCPEVQLLGPDHPLALGRSSRGFLGVEPTAMTPELRQHFGLPGDAGVMVARVIEDSAAAAAGLAVGDIITRVDDHEIVAPHDLGRAVRQKRGGEPIELEYWRAGQLSQASVELGEQERCAVDLGDFMGRLKLGKMAIPGLELTDEVLEALRDVDWEGTFQGLHEIDWEKHLEGLEGLKTLDLERLEERMEQVQERLHRLEEDLEREQERLERLGGDEGDGV